MDYQTQAIKITHDFIKENPSLNTEAMDLYLLFQAEIEDEAASEAHEFELLEVSLEQLKEDRL